MAKPRTPEPTPANPDVRFERTDVEPGTIVRYALTFTAVLLGAVAFVWLAIPALLAYNEPAKKTDLPAMTAEARMPEPDPRLEAIDDLVREDYQLLPPRADRSLAEQRMGLEGKVPIEDVIGKLKARKAETR